MMRVLFAFAAAVLVATPALAADPEAGAKIVKTQCGACHATAAGKNLVGPSLHGIVGRPSGSVAGFRYSAANQAAKLTWDEATLRNYIANPKELLPNGAMSYPGLKNEEQMNNLIAYLKTQGE